MRFISARTMTDSTCQASGIALPSLVITSATGSLLAGVRGEAAMAQRIGGKLSTVSGGRLRKPSRPLRRAISRYFEASR